MKVSSGFNIYLILQNSLIQPESVVLWFTYVLIVLMVIKSFSNIETSVLSKATLRDY